MPGSPAVWVKTWRTVTLSLPWAPKEQDHGCRVRQGLGLRPVGTAQPRQSGSVLIQVPVASTKLSVRKVSAARLSEVQAWATERCRPRLPAPCGSWCKLRSAFKCRRPRSSGGAQSGHPRISLPRSQREDHSIMDLRALADAMPEGCRAIVITQASLGLRVAELMVRRVPEVDGIRRGWNSRQPRTASSQYRRRHQDHDAPCHCRIWSGKALAKHIAEFPQVEDGSLSTTANGNRYRHQHHGAAHLRSGRPRDRLAPRVTLVNGHGRSKVLGTSRTPASRRSADHDHMRPVPAFPLSFGSLSLRGRSLAALVTHNGA
jgi:hypothetical protein